MRGERDDGQWPAAARALIASTPPPSTCPRAALLYNILHVTLTIISLDAYRKAAALVAAAPASAPAPAHALARARALQAVPLAAHLTFGLLTLDTARAGGCVVVLPLAAVIVGLTVLNVYFIERSPNYAGKRQQRAWEMLQASSAGQAPR